MIIFSEAHAGTPRHTIHLKPGHTRIGLTRYPFQLTDAHAPDAVAIVFRHGEANVDPALCEFLTAAGIASLDFRRLAANLILQGVREAARETRQ
jgi:hypothetical protein